MFDSFRLCSMSLSVILQPLPEGWSVRQLSDTCDNLKVISEMLCVQHYCMILDTFSMADVADIIETLYCIVCIVILLYFFCHEINIK